eukprot:gnl/TRDRNA2_/TRDRNA2_128723_c0_seq2.p1 gnl/TRDRNA2_/TRDRNA2_128723_c0~~gnl/TRDRNA2_/TRDRNA2_128723_c0_seq2.p1  ORF type:complete len:452 (-),score=59.58 gnl/TRDRNA2_/TRDRNA2_128723_c0_seq2:82-1437(-)
MVEILDVVTSLVSSLDACTFWRCAAASSGARRVLSASASVVVAVLDDEDGLDDMPPCFTLPLWQLQAASDHCGMSPLFAGCGSEGWAAPWRERLGLPRCLDWSVVPWRLACSSLERLWRTEPYLRAELSMLPEVSLLDRLEILGAPWAPLSRPPPTELALPRLRRVWVDNAACALWPAGCCVSKLCVTEPLAAQPPIGARGVSTLRLAGTTTEDLGAVDEITPSVRELEIVLPVFESCSLDTSYWELDLELPEEPPRIHVAPNPARFASLQRLQAHLDTQTLVILGPFAQALPALKRLGTIHIDPCGNAGAAYGRLPRGLEECVLAILDRETPDGCVTCGLEMLLGAPSLHCSCMHVCLFAAGQEYVTGGLGQAEHPDKLEKLLAGVMQRHLKPNGWCLASTPDVGEDALGSMLQSCRGTLGPSRFSIRPRWLSALGPAESTPLDRPLPFY